jgi:hypothetical protein
LFDLGTPARVTTNFENPIKAGCYKKASQDEVDFDKELAARVQEIIITPFLLRREKKM